MRLNPLPVAAAGYVARPFVIFQIPLHRLADAALERLSWPPSKFPLNLRRIHCVTPVVSRTILHKRDQPATRSSTATSHLIHKVTDCFHDVDIPLLVPAANVVSLPRSTSREHGRDRFAVILYIKPIADVLPVPINGKRLTVARVQNHQRYQFFRELKWPIIIRTVR